MAGSYFPAKPIEKHAVFVATSTQEKIRDLNIAAEAHGLPIYFFNLKQVAGTFHNVEENGLDAIENASKKLGNVEQQKEYLRNNPKKITEFLAKRSIESAPDRVWFATEDCGLSLPRILWDEMNIDALKGDVRDRIPEQSTAAPGVETAPVLSSWLGARNMYTNIINAIRAAKTKCATLDEKNLIFTEVSCLKFENLQNPDLIIDSKGEAQTRFNYAHDAFNHGKHFATYDFMGPIDMVSKASARMGKITAMDLGVEYIAHHGARRYALRKMVDTINRLGYPNLKIDVLDKNIPDYKERLRIRKQDLAVGQKLSVGDFRVGMVNADDVGKLTPLDRCLKDRGFGSPYHCQAFEETRDNKNAIDRAVDILSTPEHLLQHSDGVILLADELSKNPLSLKEKLYILNSLVVAKQLSIRDDEKPFVIINSDHSWDAAIEIHNSLANANLTKDHVIPLSPKLDKVEINSNAYFHVISGEILDCMQAATMIMHDAAITYHRQDAEPSEPKQRGNDTAADKNSTALFCSASCENEHLNAMIRRLTKKLAKKNIPVYYGAGDRYSMGAGYDGVLEYRWEEIVKDHPELQDNTSEIEKLLEQEPYKSMGTIQGYSTAPIIKSETQGGTFPKHLNYAEQCGDIYARMVKMLEAKNVIVTAGGAGSLQEWMAAEILKEKMPEIYKKKKLTILDPDLMPQARDIGKLGAKQFEISHVYDNILRKVYDKMYIPLALNNKNMLLQWPKGVPKRDDLSIVRNEDEAIEQIAPSLSRSRTLATSGAGIGH